jgi:hypothetical protein
MEQALCDFTANHELVEAVAAITTAIVAALAFIISVVSLYVAHATLKHQRAHNVLSLRPLPMIAVGDYEERTFVKLRNDGPGPLIIQRLEARREAESKNALVDWMPDLPHGIDWSTFVGSIEGRSVPSGGDLTLLELPGNEHNGLYVEARNGVRKALSQLTVVVHYTDVYGSRLDPYTKHLSWFSRLMAPTK